MRTLSVFEHEKVVVRDGSPPHAGPHLRPAEFDALARWNDANEGQFLALGHRSITFRQWVGVLQVGDLTVEVLPKTDRAPAQARGVDRWRSVLLTMLRVVWSLPLHDGGNAAQRLDAGALFELVVGRFTDEVERLQSQGFARGYRDVEGNQSALRGRLVFAEHLRENLVRADRFFVRYPVFDFDVPHNRVLAAALAVVRDLPLRHDLHRRVTALAETFPPLPTRRLPRDAFDRLVWTRATDRYRAAVDLARMILHQQAPALRAGEAPVFAMLFDMNALWEGFVAAVCRRALHGQRRFVVRAQSPVAFWRPRGGATRRVYPDVSIIDQQTGATALVLDTKWKAPDAGPSIEDLRQVFAYNELCGSPRGVLLYPKLPEPRSFSGPFAGRAHRCDLASLDVAGLRANASSLAAVVEATRDVLGLDST